MNAVIYFSPTGNTKKYLDAMGHALGGAESIDVTVDAAPEMRRFGKDDFVILGMPVYVGRVPTAAKSRFSGFTGDGTPCIVVVTYGNRHYDDALLEIVHIAQEQGFVVKGAATLIGRHTYGNIQVDRPNADDLAACRDFAQQAAAKPDDTPAPAVPGNIPYKDGGNGGKFRPQTADSCVSCGLCARLCPMQAIGEDCKTVSDACIACFRCIRSCPVSAKNADYEAYNSFAAAFTEKLKERRENEFFL